MTIPPTTLVLRRRAARLAIRLLDPFALRVLILLALRADPRTGRDWYALTTLADDLRATEKDSEHALRELERLGFIERLPAHGAWSASIELGPIFVRETPPPHNLPTPPYEPGSP